MTEYRPIIYNISSYQQKKNILKDSQLCVSESFTDEYR